MMCQCLRGNVESRGQIGPRGARARASVTGGVGRGREAGGTGERRGWGEARRDETGRPLGARVQCPGGPSIRPKRDRDKFLSTGENGELSSNTGSMSVLALQEYEFERQFNEREAIQWMQENWKKSFLYSALYAAFIFGGRHLMKQRAKFELRKPLVVWSLSLALFSIIGAVRTGAYMVYILTTSGLKQSVCDQGFYNGPISKFWAYAFVLSKAPELGDTFFIILRKQKLIFLHWYHHITVLLYSWYSYKDMVAGGGWFMTMNYGVHAVMYSYYALRAAGFRVSRKFAMFITMTQITQMVLGCVVNYLVYEWMQQGQCPSHMHNIIWSSLMYLSYFVLFCQFFHGAYLSNSTRKALKAN